MKSRRVLGCVGLFILLVGCDNKGRQKAVGIGLTGVGTVLVVIPTGWTQVIGCTLIASGTAVLVEAEWSDGSRRTVEVPLTEEQQKQVKEGAKVGVTN